MGNRGVIATHDKDLGVYLHWNGGRDSVEGFLKFCKLKGYPSPEQDIYGWARLCQVIGNWFGGTNCVGIGLYDTLDLDNWDNGVYYIRNWEIVGREFHRGAEQTEYSLLEFVNDVNDAQPPKEQLTVEEITENW